MYKRPGNFAGGAASALRGGGARAVAPDEPRLPVLMIVHQRQSSPGNVGNWFQASGFPLDIRRPRFGDPLPETLEGHTGAVIFGGPQSANDTDDFIRREIDWISVALREEKPFLGICLGAQMLALHLGGEVGSHPQGCVEMGYYPIRPTADGARLMDWPAQVYQWHREGFSAPGESVLLAEGEEFAQQAFAYRSAYGLQFHPEITHLVMNRWVTRSGYRLVMPGAKPGPGHRQDHMVHGPRQRDWLDRFLRMWAGAPAR
ncbi:GMP synthase [glutamine-hydrolyzing] [bacterium BMS3Bbin10]|nr:GMP synthase [glutamine-hydrolyzing] [bacterium BMS3Bbin10]HDL16804.1 glutamine amidotransferase [Hyphomicrobiales bacterium]